MSEFAEDTGVELADGNYETAAGYVIDRLGRLAEIGDEVTVDGVVIRVAECEGRRITTLDVHLPSPTDE